MTIATVVRVRPTATRHTDATVYPHLLAYTRHQPVHLDSVLGLLTKKKPLQKLPKTSGILIDASTWFASRSLSVWYL